MNIEELWAQIEDDFTWRIDEIRFFENQLTQFDEEPAREKLRRALILLLYSHFEGFCKFSFLLYIGAINSEALSFRQVNSSIIASSLHQMFEDLRNPNTKSSLFRAALPDDSKLHRFARDKEFVVNSESIYNMLVSLPEDIVDMESNLKAPVLRKTLFKLGFPHDLFKGIEGRIELLLKHRNKIAHGESKAGIPVKEYNIVKTAAYAIMREIKQKVMQYLISKSYLKEDEFDFELFGLIKSNGF